MINYQHEKNFPVSTRNKNFYSLCPFIRFYIDFACFFFFAHVHKYGFSRENFFMFSRSPLMIFVFVNKEMENARRRRN